MRLRLHRAARWLDRRRRRLSRRLAARFRPRTMPRQAWLLLWLTALAVVVAVTGALAPQWAPTSAMVFVLLLGGFFLRMRTMVLLYLVAAAGAALTVSVPGEGGLSTRPGDLVLLAATAVLVAIFVRSRERLGVQGTLGDTMLVDLRDRLRSQGRVPPLPPQWHVETELRPAFGDAFSGDFVVATRTPGQQGDLLEVVLVDVSGKGQGAGTRALLLSGAFGGLLGAMPVEGFLPAANAYLLRQDWPEGFATAVHLAVDLGTGRFRVGCAGHPPPGTGGAGEPWRLLDDDGGPALGLVPDVDFPAVHGQLLPGQALYLCTDGMVELPGEDLSVGTETLLRLASEAGRSGWREGAAVRLVDAAAVEESDDRALVLVWRSA
ncbi:MAG: PP2C family protein-serine/threonine phosphatase [Quadrisphaera sp.]